MNIGDKQPGSFEIKEADYIVSFAKRISREVSSFTISQDINFIGCSQSYVEEKLYTAINDLRWLHTTLKELDKKQRRNKEK